MNRIRRCPISLQNSAVSISRISTTLNIISGKAGQQRYALFSLRYSVKSVLVFQHDVNERRKTQTGFHLLPYKACRYSFTNGLFTWLLAKALGAAAVPVPYTEYTPRHALCLDRPVVVPIDTHKEIPQYTARDVRLCHTPPLVTTEPPSPGLRA